MTNYTDFRRALDAVLRRRDPQALCDFLIERGQWEPDAVPDPAYMWLMIAGSPALADLHAEAEVWLRAHGRVAQADEIAVRRQGRAGQTRSQNKPQPRKPS
ncbi:MAG TPA: hypothetical protein VKB76_10005 [Ktedonobacterales bacterium]|nr:hypothetical protein [Ktedonobacterales bacterium]